MHQRMSKSVPSLGTDVCAELSNGWWSLPEGALLRVEEQGVGFPVEQAHTQFSPGGWDTTHVTRARAAVSFTITALLVGFSACTAFATSCN